MGRRKDSPELVPAKLGVYNLERLWDRADVLDRNEGMFYYRQFQARLMDGCRRFNKIPLTTACGVYAALSPNNSESSCLHDTFVGITSFACGMEEWRKFKPHTYEPNKRKALRILDGEDPDMVLRGPKTNAFYHNILDPTDPRYVTVDGHMVNCWNNLRVPLDYAGINAGQYRIVADGIREVAGRRGLVPCQFQAVIWLLWRRINWILRKDQYELPYPGGSEDRIHG